MADWMYIAVRAIGALTAIFIITRILGKKQISQLTFFEYIIGITIGELAGFISTDVENNYMHGLVAMAVWFLIPFAVEMLSLRSLTVRHWFEGKERIFIKEGKILEDNLRKERYTVNELLEQLRIKNVFRVADVEFAILETNGELSVLLKKQYQPLTPAHLGVQVAPEEEPQTVIMDGVIMDESLSVIGLNRGWLMTELSKIGVTVENVFVAQVDSLKQLYVDTYDDKLTVPEPNLKLSVWAQLKQVQANLESFALETQHAEAKQMYERCSKQMNVVIQQVGALLNR